VVSVSTGTGADIVQLNGNIRPRSRPWWQVFRMLSQWHVYVVIVERRSFSIVAAVELDDARKLLQMTGEWLNTTEADQQSPEHRS